MSAASGDDETGIYEPLGPPFRSIIDAQKGPILIVTTVPLLVVAALTVFVRIWTVCSVTRRLGPSEATIIASIAFATGYTVSINRAVQDGLGTAAEDLASVSLAGLSQKYYTANILLILSITCAKASVILFFIKIIGWKSMWKVGRYSSQALLAYAVLWGVASIFAVAFQCSNPRWALGPGDNTTCNDLYATQIGIRVTDMISDLAIALLPVLLMRILQTKLKSRLLVVALFGVRITTIIPCIISVAALAKFYEAELDDRPFRAVTPSVWTSVWLFLSITTACVPSIRQFLADWAAGLAGAAINEGLEEDYTKSRSGNKTTNMERSQRSTQLAQKLGLASSSRAMVTSTSRSGQGRNRDDDRNPRLVQKARSDDTSESVRHLTEGVIMHTTDYAVEYEDHEMVAMHRDGSTSSGIESGPALRTRV